MAFGVRFVSTCRLDTASPPSELPSVAQAHIIAACDHAALLRGEDVTITCLAEGHPPTDPHTRRMAADIRVTDGDESAAATLATYLASYFGPTWAVLYESPVGPSDPTLARFYYYDRNSTGPHLHVQPVKGTSYP